MNYVTLFKKLAFGFVLLISLQGFAQQADIAKNNVKGPSASDTYFGEENKQVFSIFPTTIKRSAKLTIDSPVETWVTFELRDKCGAIVLEQQMSVEKGVNIIPVFFISKIDKGEYISVLRLEDKVFFSSLVKE
ncbi:MAG: hypothetical protein J7497_11225 [Chitinophagaceae bacterium]|nr:hypothetical protein [Chitinophagaceae bacterium]